MPVHLENLSGVLKSRRWARVGVLALVGLASLLATAVLAACGDATPTATEPASPAPTVAPPAPTVATAPTPAPGMVTVRATDHPDLGPILTDAVGRTLYLFTNDEPGVSNCSGGCADRWPPQATGEGHVGPGIDDALLGSLQRADGSSQASYNGWPLYYFAGDQAPGDVAGHEVGGVWFAVTPSGDQAGSPMVAPTSAPATVVVTVSVVDHADLGPILVDADGLTLYLFTRDEPGVSNCSGGCADRWPPLGAGDALSGADGVVETLLGTLQRSDDSSQASYNGWPLYYFVSDLAPGDVTGHEVGDVWFAVTPAGDQAESPMVAPAPTPAPVPATISVVDHADLGPILVDADGLTLYLFTRDEPGVSNCSGGCADRWPPLGAGDALAAADGVDEALLGVIQRSDGSSQVSYNGWPLYYFVSDLAPDDVTGHEVGGVWFAVTPAGDQAESSMAAPVPTPTPTPTPTPEAAAGATVQSDIRQFTLPILTVDVGTTVTWTNRDSAPHTATSGTGGLFDGVSWDSPILGQGDSYSHTFTEVGTFSYTCRVHPSMSGTVTVVAEGGGSTTQDNATSDASDDGAYTEY